MRTETAKINASKEIHKILKNVGENGINRLRLFNQLEEKYGLSGWLNKKIDNLIQLEEIEQIGEKIRLNNKKC